MLFALPIDLSAMADADDQNRELSVDRLVDDPVASYPKPSQSPELSFERGASRRFMSQPVDRLDQSGPLLGLDPPESLGGATLDLDRVAHA